MQIFSNKLNIYGLSNSFVMVSATLNDKTEQKIPEILERELNNSKVCQEKI